jgi:hypothetical protein
MWLSHRFDLHKPGKNTRLSERMRNNRNLFVGIGIGFLVALVIGAISFVAWASRPMAATAEAISRLQSDEFVRFWIHERGWLVFEPTHAPTGSGLVWYPEARVDVQAYGALAKTVAASGHLVVIVPMPLNMAFLDPDAARSVVRAFPNVGAWAVGGHGIGASMAAELVRDSATFTGLLLCGAYPGPLVDLTKRSGLLVYDIYGTNDLLALPQKVVLAKKQFPTTAHFVEIVGGNHAGFGYYGKQAGDGDAQITADQQQQTVAQYVEEFLDILGT